MQIISPQNEISDVYQQGIKITSNYMFILLGDLIHLSWGWGRVGGGVGVGGWEL